MTAQIDETKADGNTETESVNIAERWDGVAASMVEKVAELIAQNNSNVDWLKEHSGDLVSVMDALRESDDETIVKLVAELEKRKAAAEKADDALRKVLKEKAEAQIANSKDSEEIDKRNAALKENRTLIASFRKTLGLSYGDDILEHLPEEKRLTKSGKVSSGDGTRKLRGFTVYVDGTIAFTNIGGEKKSSFGAAANVMNSDVGRLQDDYFKAAETTVAAEFPHDVTFPHTVGDKEFKVRAVHNPSDKRNSDK